jgi:Domain of unknown function (DUF4157)
MLHTVTSETKRRSGGRPCLAADMANHSTTPRSPLATAQSAYGNQVMLRYLSAGNKTASGVVQRKCACGGSGGDCAECKKKEPDLQRKATSRGGRAPAVPAIVHDVLRSPGQPLDRGTRAAMESGFGRDFSAVRIHNDAQAAKSAGAVNALAYTVGRDVVFARNQFALTTKEGQRLLAHELTHVVQQGSDSHRAPQSIGREDDSFEREADRSAEDVAARGSRHEETATGAAGVLQRTPARKVSCAPGPLNLPNGDVVDDPVGVITAAENRANELLDQAIGELDFTRQQILAGAPIGFPTISDGLATGLRLIGLDPSSERVWKQVGGPTNYTAELLLRRLRLIRGTIGSGSFFFTCLGPQNGSIGPCVGPICAAANAASCAGSFLIDFCQGFWTEDSEFQAGTVLHESSHNFAAFIGATREVGNGSDVAECYSRFAQVVGGTDLGGQRPDLCPDV